MLTTIVAVLAACSAHADALFIASAVIITNIIGIVVGLIVTHLFGFPNDGKTATAESNAEYPDA